MNIPMLDLSRQHVLYKEQLLEASRRVLEHGQFILGKEVSNFEQSLGAYEDGAHVVGVSSGTDALLVALMALGIDADAEVVVPAFSFFATAGVVQRLGARPVFVDICPHTYNAKSEALLNAVTERTRAVMPVYLFGQMSSIESLHQAEVGGRPRLKLLPLIFKRMWVMPPINCYKNRNAKKS